MTDADGTPALRPRRRFWFVTSLAIAVVGIACTLLAAWSVSNSEAQKSHESAVTTSVQVASNLTLALQREQDLVVNTGAFLLGQPSATQAQFQQWTSDAKVFERYPEVLGIVDVVVVLQSQLAAYAAEVNANPAGVLPPGTTFTVTPPGNRPYYCFPKLSQNRSGQPGRPRGHRSLRQLARHRIPEHDEDRGEHLPPLRERANATMVIGAPINWPGSPTPPHLRCRKGRVRRLHGNRDQPGDDPRRARCGATPTPPWCSATPAMV